MPTTINAQNALQIREKPMEVYITLQTGDSATISTYTSGGSIKSDDYKSLGNTSWQMRGIADLANGGFPLDGSRELYKSLTSSATNGKLGVRGNVGQTITVAITAGASIGSVTVKSEGVATISVGGNSYPGAGLNIIPINSSNATLTFTPTDANTRAEVEYIVPGVILTATNDNLLGCTLALRSNLKVSDHTWEESEIEFQLYYPYDISSTFAYIQNDWPITYQAGYDSDLSLERMFYLSEPIQQKDKAITIKGVDASHLLDKKNRAERWISTKAGQARRWLYNDFVNQIEAAGIAIQRKGTAPTGSNSGAQRYVVVPEKTSRDWISDVMNLTLSHKRGGNSLGIQFVDAGIPTVEFGDGTTYGNTWSINKSDCGDWEETFEQNVAEITAGEAEHLYNETYTINTNKARIVDKQTGIKQNQIVAFSYDGYYWAPKLFWYTEKNGEITSSGLTTAYNVISSTPSTYTVKFTADNNYYIAAVPVQQTAIGTSTYSNPNDLAGITVEMEPAVYGDLADTVDPILNHESLFDRDLRTVSFTWKGDPRMQPLDYLSITDDTVTPNVTTTYRVSNIELTHEAGGTQAKIEARRWN